MHINNVSLYKNNNYFAFLWFLKSFLNKHDCNFDDVIQIKMFWSKDYTVIISVHDSNYIIDVAMWPKFGNSSISMRQKKLINQFFPILFLVTSCFYIKSKCFIQNAWKRFSSSQINTSRVQYVNTSVPDTTSVTS